MSVAAGDTIIGYTGADVLRGGPGPDDLNAKDLISGNDQVFGDKGTDTCLADAGDAIAGCP